VISDERGLIILGRRRRRRLLLLLQQQLNARALRRISQQLLGRGVEVVVSYAARGRGSTRKNMSSGCEDMHTTPVAPHGDVSTLHNVDGGWRKAS